MKRVLSILLCLVLVIGIAPCSSITADAVSKKTKSKAYKAYRNWIYETNYSGFCVYDIDKDGLKELLMTFDGAGKNIFSFDVYTYKKGKVVQCNQGWSFEYSPFGLMYNKSTKRIHGSRGGGGSIENWYYTLSKSKKLKRVTLSKVESGYNYKTGKISYKYYYKDKKITKKEYTKKLKSWNKNLKTFKFYKTTKKNAKKYVK